MQCMTYRVRAGHLFRCCLALPHEAGRHYFVRKLS